MVVGERMKKTVFLEEPETLLIQKMLLKGFDGLFLTVAEFEALNSLRAKFDLPSIDGVDDEFIRAYGNCYAGCNE